VTQERFLVTGALGCIGAWVVRCLVREDVPVTTFDLAGNPHRLRLIMDDDELARVQFIAGDITDLDALERAIGETGTTRLIHLAGLQVPFCKADPALGARVNVVGTVNVFEAARRAGLRHIVYASSIAVYGISEEYPEGPITHDAMLRPRTHYGVYKQANEGTARIYWLDDGIASIGLRPYIVYGPARDQGMTSQPTKAMLAAALGRPHTIPFGGRAVYQYTEDTALAFVQAARAPFAGADAFNLGGSVAQMRDIIAGIEAAAPASRGQITFADQPLPFPAEMDGAPLEAAIGPIRHTPLAEGISGTVALFQTAIARGRLAVD
jgi:UDP-glucuronate 4-epimerase